MGFLQVSGLGRIHYHEYGNGDKPMLAFHGYGMTGKQFHVLKESILTKYHVYGFDHFFHGESQLEPWREKQILAGMPKTLVKSYLEEWFKIYGKQKVSLMAYSIGAKLALILLEEFPEWIDEIIMMAPDGLTVYKGFDFLTNNPIGKYFFRNVTKSNWMAPLLLRNLRRLRIIDENLYNIAYNEMDTEKKRLDVYYTLNLIGKLQPDTAKILKGIDEHSIKCTIIFGKDDKLFPKSAAKTFTDQLTKARIHEAPLGHWLVVPAVDKYLLDLSE